MPPLTKRTTSWLIAAIILLAFGVVFGPDVAIEMFGEVKNVPSETMETGE